MKSDITGEEKEYKVNNAVWLYLDSLFDMDQSNFDEELKHSSNVAMAKFTTAVLNANHIDVTFEELMENTDPKGVIKFYNDFFDIAFGVDEEVKQKAEQAQENREKQKSKKN